MSQWNGWSAFGDLRFGEIETFSTSLESLTQLPWSARSGSWGPISGVPNSTLAPYRMAHSPSYRGPQSHIPNPDPSLLHAWPPEQALGPTHFCVSPGRQTVAWGVTLDDGPGEPAEPTTALRSPMSWAPLSASALQRMCKWPLPTSFSLPGAPEIFCPSSPSTI